MNIANNQAVIKKLGNSILKTMLFLIFYGAITTLFFPVLMVLVVKLGAKNSALFIGFLYGMFYLASNAIIQSIGWSVNFVRSRRRKKVFIAFTEYGVSCQNTLSAITGISEQGVASAFNDLKVKGYITHEQLEYADKMTAYYRDKQVIK